MLMAAGACEAADPGPASDPSPALDHSHFTPTHLSGEELHQSPALGLPSALALSSERSQGTGWPVRPKTAAGSRRWWCSRCALRG